MLGLYEWSKAKSAAVKAKADAIESGDRERSPTASPDPYQVPILRLLNLQLQRWRCRWLQRFYF
jgi:hypothetical protein